MKKLYTNTNVVITLTPGTGFVMADVISVSATFTHAETSASITLTSVGGQITLGLTTMTVNIPNNGITESGVYLLRITFTDAGNNIRGLTPDVEYLRFW